MMFQGIRRRIEAIERRTRGSKNRKLTAFDLVVVAAGHTGPTVEACTRLDLYNEVRGADLDDGAHGATAWLGSALEGMEGSSAFA
jgi:hypothetical protein